VGIIDYEPSSRHKNLKHGTNEIVSHDLVDRKLQLCSSFRAVPFSKFTFPTLESDQFLFAPPQESGRVVLLPTECDPSSRTPTIAP